MSHVQLPVPQLWAPSREIAINSNLHHYMEWLKDTRKLAFSDYHEMWRWSVNDIPSFWKSIIEYFDIQYNGSFDKVVSEHDMPHVKWFEGIQLSYAEHVFRKRTDKYPAIVCKSESTVLNEISWAQLTAQVAAVQQYLRSIGVGKGDRIVAFMPCIPEATIAFLAVNSLGAVWSSCSPDFGANSVIDRFAQIEPKILFAVDGYQYNGKYHDKTDVVASITKAIPSIEKVILIENSNGTVPSLNNQTASWHDIPPANASELEFVRIPFNDPIWVLYSSGTTGLPKPITHSQGGILLEQLKYVTFHNDFKPGERCFWYTTTGWMMWNYIHGSLLVGGTMVLYDGSPAWSDLNVLWKFVQDAGIHHFGTSAGFILACMKDGIRPSQRFDLSTLRSIGSTGSTLPPEGFDWIYNVVKKDLWLASMSGGTDVCSAFVGGNPLWPVYSGEIQCRALGCKLEAYDDNAKPVIDEVGEMVITAPMPSMPVFFWNDPEYRRYTESYFEFFPGVWRHGDWIRITPRNGIVIYGRSDATLNRGGIRIGTSEVYRAVDKIREVKDSLIICIEKERGDFWMPLFVVMQEGIVLTEEIKKRINAALRTEYSPRHVPDEIIAAPDIPYTISGKKTETPVKKILMGQAPEKVINAGALRNPGAMDFFVKLTKLK